MRRIAFVMAFLFCCAVASAQDSPWQGVESALGRNGVEKDGMLKVTFPRTDLEVTVQGVKLDPRFALTTWIAFAPLAHAGTSGHVMVMGDLVLLDSEVAPAMAKLVAQGLDVTALHNHLLGETPAVKYMHVEGVGDPLKLAQAIHAVLAVTRTPIDAPLSDGPRILSDVTVDWSRVENAMGRTGTNGIVLQFSIPRAETLNDHRMPMPPFMGMATGINFQRVGDKVAATGDFVLIADEVNPVVRELTNAGITVTAIHNHMLHDDPRLFMLHFWGFGEPTKIAAGIRAALSKTNSKKE